MALKAMHQDEKIRLVHGQGWGALTGPAQPGSNAGSGFVLGVPRLGIPNLDMDDAAQGVRLSAANGRYSTALPAELGLAASWDIERAEIYGRLIGRELRAQGYNVGLGGGVNLTRDPRGGRNFEFSGEDPVLAGTIVGHLIDGLQSQRVMTTVKHYALNNQETQRGSGNVKIDENAMRESDLLAFQIALKIGEPAAVMCAYNKVNGDHACENDFLLNKVLKTDFGFKGFVMSDWEATHSTVKAALAGLDQEQPTGDYFGQALQTAIDRGQVPQSRLDDMARRILRSMFATGVIDAPAKRFTIDPFLGRDEAKRIEDAAIVLLKNDGDRLPLSDSIRTIAVIGGHADIGVIGGSGSAIVDPPGGEMLPKPKGVQDWQRPVYYPSAPLKFIRVRAPAAKVEFTDGTDMTAAVKLAARSDIAIVFAEQHRSEGSDADFDLPDRLNTLIAAIAAANPNTVVVLETGGPVAMPWLGKVAAVAEAWYPGIGGGEAIADMLFGVTNPSGKLPITFPRTTADLPHPTIAGSGILGALSADIPYPEGARVGYKWFESEGKPVLFSFGFGLSYTNFSYSGLTVDAVAKTVGFRLCNTGSRAGAEVAQVYAALPAAAGEKFKRLVGWQRVTLAAGACQQVTLTVDLQYLSKAESDRWTLPTGEFRIFVGSSSAILPLQAAVTWH